MLVRSSVVYKYTCDCCQQFYIGSTALQLFRRCAQRRGSFKILIFNVIESAAQLLEIRIFKFIHITKNNLEINKYETATTVNVLDITQSLP